MTGGLNRSGARIAAAEIRTVRTTPRCAERVGCLEYMILELWLLFDQESKIITGRGRAGGAAAGRLATVAPPGSERLGARLFVGHEAHPAEQRMQQVALVGVQIGEQLRLGL